MSKTVKVAVLLEKANTALASTDWAKTERSKFIRLGICSMIETVLFTAGCYAGFRYLDDYEEGVSDESRRSYYLSNKLR